MTIDFDSPQRVDVTMMMLGDSISHGSTGDWTWRYRFWQHLHANNVAVDFVGPKKTLDTVATAQMGDEDFEYADAEFDRDHACQWGLPYVKAKDDIQHLVAEFDPDYVLVLLGINDLVWFDIQPAEFEVNLREFIANARVGGPRVGLILGTILDTNRAHEDIDFCRRVHSCNEIIRSVSAELTTVRSPIEAADTMREFFAPDHTWDGVHPNPRGELRVAAAFADVLAKRFGVGSVYPRPYADVEDVSAHHKQDAKPAVHLEAAHGGLRAILDPAANPELQRRIGKNGDYR